MQGRCPTYNNGGMRRRGAPSLHASRDIGVSVHVDIPCRLAAGPDAPPTQVFRFNSRRIRLTLCTCGVIAA